MTFPFQKFREMVFQLLFSIDMNGGAEEELIPFLMQELAVSKKHVRAAYAKALEIWGQKEFLDAIIGKQAQAYAFERIKSVEKTVLRLALYELLIEKELNLKMVIAEAHRLTRKFGSIEGASFVHALLDSVEKREDVALSLSETESIE
jgi:N utilization substance protein B